jgi:hypothetical protein
MGGDALASFEGLEQKMQHHEKNIFHLRDFIDAKVSIRLFSISHLVLLIA